MNDLQHSTLDQITAEILVYKQQTAQNIIEIGRRLIRAKEILPHGAWGNWLRERVEFSHPTANRFMQVAREFGNSSALKNLNPTKIYALLEVPAEEREQFIQQPHQLPTGETKTVDEMTTRELQEAIRARKKAEAEAENLRKQLAEARNKKPEVVEKVVVPPEVNAELERLNEENKKLQRKNLNLEARLSTSQQDPAERIKKARLSQKALDEEFLWFNTRIKTFLKEVAPYIYAADMFMRMSPEKVRQHEEALIKLEDWLRRMKQALPYGGEVIEIQENEKVVMNE